MKYVVVAVSHQIYTAGEGSGGTTIASIRFDTHGAAVEAANWLRGLVHDGFIKTRVIPDGVAG